MIIGSDMNEIVGRNGTRKLFVTDGDGDINDISHLQPSATAPVCSIS